MNAKVSLNAILGETKVAVGEVLDMESGNLIKLPTTVYTPLTVKIGDDEVFKGIVGILKGIRAFKVNEILVLSRRDDEEEE
jgi:flagellar motor switch protein FliM